MRRSIRPFTVETKKTARRADKVDQPPQASMKSLFIEPEPVVEVRRHSPQRAAAEALFDGPAPVRAQPGAPEAGARILQSLIEPPVFQGYDDLLEEPVVRRGRKPGSKNKPREDAPPPRQGRTLRPSWADFIAEAEAPASEPEIEFAFTPRPAALAPEPAELTSLRRSGRMARDYLPRGERWKARLPKFARQSGWIKRARH